MFDVAVVGDEMFAAVAGIGFCSLRTWVGLDAFEFVAVAVDGGVGLVLDHLETVVEFALAVVVRNWYDDHFEEDIAVAAVEIEIE